jgi:drug/metabolite transporter superfamily protein YnfA
MTYPVVRKVQYALAASLGALILIESTAFAKAQDPTFEGSWLIAVGAIVFAVIALWLTCVGSLRSDRMDRYRSSGSGRNGHILGDIDGSMHVH